jgi:hypothetical protein
MVAVPGSRLGDLTAGGLIAYDVLAVVIETKYVSAQLTERIGGTSTCWMPVLALIPAAIFAATAAAFAAASPGSWAAFSVLEPAGLSVAPRSTGLRWRRGSDSRFEGDRERRSKREDDGRSDVSRSKRERDGRSESSRSKRERDGRSDSSRSKRERDAGAGASSSKRERWRRSSDMAGESAVLCGLAGRRGCLAKDLEAEARCQD